MNDLTDLEHVWTRCPECPRKDQPCACAGTACTTCVACEWAEEDWSNPEYGIGPGGVPQ